MTDEGEIPDIAKLLGDSDDDNDRIPRVRHDFDAAALVAGLGDFGQHLEDGPTLAAPSGSVGRGQLQAGAFSDGDAFTPLSSTATSAAPAAPQPSRAEPQSSPVKGLPSPSSVPSAATAPVSTAGRVWMERLPASMTEGELLGHLHTAGDPHNVFIFTTAKRVPAKSRTSVNAVVDFANAEEAACFVRAYDGVRAGDYRLRCTATRPEYWWRPDVARSRQTRHFGQDQPGRTLSEHLDDSLQRQQVVHYSHVDEHGVPIRIGLGGDSPGPAVAAQPPTTNALTVSANVGAALLRAAGDAANYVTTENTADYLAAKSALMAISQHTVRRREQLAPGLQTAALLNGTDAAFICDLLLAALHIVHGEHEEGIRYAQALLQALPSSLDVLAYLGSYNGGALDAISAPRGFTPLLLNHLVALGMMLEQVSVVAARAVLHTAQHRAVVHGIPACAELDTVLSTVPVPLSHPSASKASSLLHALGKQDSSFAAQLLQQLAFTSNPEPFAAPCVCIFDSASAVNPGLGPVW